MNRLLRFDNLAGLAIPPLLLQCMALNWSSPLTWPTWALVIAAAFKLRVCRRPFDHRLVAVLQLLSAGLLAAQLQGLLPTVLQLLAVLMALGGLLKQELGGLLSLGGLLRRSLQLLLATLPLALLLFLFVPRVPPLLISDLAASRGAVTGLSPDLDPLSIAELAAVDAPAARMLVSEGETLPTDAYWRVLVHEQFDGRRWQHRDPPLSSTRGSAGRVAAESSQWWVVEPSANRVVPWDGRSLPMARNQWISGEGELLLGAASRQRRSFRMGSGQAALAWQRRAPLASERELPPEGLPRLRALGAEWRALPSDRDRLAAAERWFRNQPFRYSLRPGPMTDLDVFLFEDRLGFCGHYASALAALMRSADVPSRVVSGYLGGQVVQPLSGGSYLDLRQSNAHAWVEVWLEGLGWRRVDPTVWISGAGTGADGAAAGQQDQSVGAGARAAVPWWQWLQWQWWGLDLAWTRWWLGFDQSTQQAWLEALFGARLRWLGLTLVGTALASVALGWGLLRFRVSLQTPLEQSLRLLARLGVTPVRGESFSQLCRRAAQVCPDRAPLLLAMAEHQQALVHARLTRAQRRGHRRGWTQSRRQLLTLPAVSVSDVSVPADRGLRRGGFPSDRSARH